MTVDIPINRQAIRGKLQYSLSRWPNKTSVCGQGYSGRLFVTNNTIGSLIKTCSMDWIMDNKSYRTCPIPRQN